MQQSKWIWFPGDFEIFHSNLVHSRREDFGIDYPSVWMQYSPYPRVNFTKEFECGEERTIRVCSRSMGMILLDGQRFALNQPLTIPAGRHTLQVCLMETAGLPSIYIDDDVYGTDSSWMVSNGSANYYPAGDEPAYTGEQANPQKFAFSYSPLYPHTAEKTADGILYDFGAETFGPISLSGLSPEDEVAVCYGESREEALDWEHAFVRQRLQGAAEYHLAPRAFRYLFVRADGKEHYTLQAQYEYLPLEDVGDFCCEDPMVEKIWDVCAYTFHLNSREFYQDGIKRDRWVWSGDSYQSFLINRYLYLDPAITRRTILALLGKPPYEQHVNTINDYTLYLIISLWDYYYSSGDEAFVRFVWPRFLALYRFVTERLDEEGLMVQRPGDWIFIDWSPMDKEGPLCAEQILLWKAACCMAQLAQLCGQASAQYQKQADSLKALIDARYWCPEKHAYIDSFTSGKRNVTRHANVFAILYDFADAERKREIMTHVLENPDVTQITTPYFKFFELSARCRMGDLATAQQLLTSYWGGMLKDGATTIWEQYDPEATGAEHYAMYGEAYGCSLCHAWGGGPIYLLGRYCLGVYPTDIAYRTFCVEPHTGIYRELHGVVPLPDGSVRVDYKDGCLQVLSTCVGGTLIADGKKYPLPAGKPFTLQVQLH